MIDPNRVKEIFMDSLFRDGENTDKHVKAEGIMCTVGFHPERIESHRAEVESMLSQLPDDFKTSGGGGMSFLNACMDKEGNHWAEHPTMEKLFQLGIALGKVKYCLPREMWSAFPGGMPYVSILM